MAVLHPRVIPLVPSLVAVSLYLLPVAVMLSVRSASGRAPNLLAVDLPCVIALDLLGILVLARFMRLDAAVLTSRALWGGAALSMAGLHALRRLPRGARRFDPGARAVMAGGAVLALVLSVWRSRPYAIWDRQWHIPLVASLRGQKIPFVNVYQPRTPLGYHVSGDVLAAALQALSWGRLHSSAALSLTHDVMFVLTAIAVSALLFRPGRSRRSSLFVLIAPAVVLLAGPLTVGRSSGYSYLNYYQMSFRPHVVLAGLLITGITAGVLLVLLPRPGEPRPKLLAPVLVMLALLAVTDEPSAGMLLPALALLAWLGRRELPERWPWVLVAALPAVAVGLAILGIPSTVSGGAALPVTVTAPHVPSLYAPTLPLASIWGPVILIADVAPLLGILIGVRIFIARTPSRELRAALAFATLVFAVGCLPLITVVVAGSPGESHRFMTLPMVVLPLVGLRVAELAWRPAVRWGVAVVLGAPVICTLVWAIVTVPAFRRFVPDGYAEGIHRVDCRDATGARLLETAQPTYIPSPSWYMWAGCHPVLAPGRSNGVGEAIDVGRPISGRAAMVALSQTFVSATEDLTVSCPVGVSTADPVCRSPPPRDACVAAGTAWRRCALTAADRRFLLTHLLDRP